MKKVLTTLATSLGIFAGSLSLVAPPANATNYDRCGYLAGYYTCVIDREYVDSLVIRYSEGDYTHIGARCDTGNWEMTGYLLSRSTANNIVRSWCGY